VLIESIHIVNDEKRIIADIRPSIVRLQLVDEFVIPCIFLSYLWISFLRTGSDSKIGNSMEFGALFLASSVENCQTMWSRIERR